MDAAQHFKEFTVYWVGKTIDGIPLTAADNLADFHSGVGFALYYGDCGSRGGLHTGGCVLPLKVTTDLYTPHSDFSFGPQHWVLVHRVPAVVYHGGRDIEIYTDRQTIDIAARHAAARERRGPVALEPVQPHPRPRASPRSRSPTTRRTLARTQADISSTFSAGDRPAPTGATGATSARLRSSDTPRPASRPWAPSSASVRRRGRPALDPAAALARLRSVPRAATGRNAAPPRRATAVLTLPLQCALPRFFWARHPPAGPALTPRSRPRVRSGLDERAAQDPRSRR